MCEPSNTAIKGKALRVGVAGVKPNVFRGKDGKPDGIDIRILKLLQKQLEFKANVKVIRTLNGAFDMVLYFKLICQISTRIEFLPCT